MELSEEVFDQTIEFIENSNSSDNNSVYSVFRDKKPDDRWRKSLSELIYTEIQDDLIKYNINRFIDVK